MSATALIEREKVRLLNDLHRQIEDHQGQAQQLAIEAGRVLLAIKVSLAHGEFTAWVEEHFEGSLRTAQTYMQLASASEEEAQRVAGLSIRAARDEIAQPRRMSSREMGDVFAGAAPSTSAPRDVATAEWSDALLRKDGRATELLLEAKSLQEGAQQLTDPRAVARAYRDAANRAQKAAATLDELAISFER